MSRALSPAITWWATQVACGSCSWCRQGRKHLPGASFIGEICPGCFAGYLVLNEERLLKLPPALNWTGQRRLNSRGGFTPPPGPALLPGKPWHHRGPGRWDYLRCSWQPPDEQTEWWTGPAAGAGPAGWEPTGCPGAAGCFGTVDTIIEAVGSGSYPEGSPEAVGNRVEGLFWPAFTKRAYWSTPNAILEKEFKIAGLMLGGEIGLKGQFRPPPPVRWTLRR